MVKYCRWLSSHAPFYLQEIYWHSMALTATDCPFMGQFLTPTMTLPCALNCVKFFLNSSNFQLKTRYFKFKQFTEMKKIKINVCLINEMTCEKRLNVCVEVIACRVSCKSTLVWECVLKKNYMKVVCYKEFGVCLMIRVKILIILS